MEEIIIKKCSKCLEEKPVTEFHKRCEYKKEGYTSQCKKCRNEFNSKYYKEDPQKFRDYYDNNLEEILEYHKEYHIKNREENNKKNRENHELNKEERNKKNRENYKKNKDKISVQKKDYRLKNLERENKRSRDYYEKNRDELLKDKILYRKIHKKEIQKTQAIWADKKRKEDPIFKLKENVRALIGISIRKKGFSKKSKTAQILGCDFDFLYDHLMLSFISNYDRYPNEKDVLNLDHIIPMVTAKTEEEVIKLNHYTNLQWLLAKDNNDKGDKLDWKLRIEPNE